MTGGWPPFQRAHGHVPMGFFGSTDTVDGKARTVLGDLPEDPSPYEILRTVDQKAGEDVDPDDVVSKMRDLNDGVDAKLDAVDGSGVDQKELREAAGTIASRSELSQDDAMDLLSNVATGDVDQDALSNLTDSKMDSDSDASDSSSTDTNPDANADGGGGVDQKQDDGDGGQMDPIDLVDEIGGSDAKDTVENYAESVGKDVQDAAAEWVAENVPGVTVEGYGDSGGDSQQPADTSPAPDQSGDAHDRQAQAPDQMSGDHDQKLGDQELNERIADAVTSDEVLGEMAGALAQKLVSDDGAVDDLAGALAQKMADDDDLADNLVGTVEQKGDFVTTEDSVVTAPSGESQTVSEAGAITGGDRGDNE